MVGGLEFNMKELFGVGKRGDLVFDGLREEEVCVWWFSVWV